MYKKRAVLPVTVKINITILVAPLDWGLGHATRCIPIIKYLLQIGCKVIIAAEGAQEKLLKTEFPLLRFVHLPGYRVQYASDKRFFPVKIIAQLPKILFFINKEKKWLKNFIATNNIDAVISDNRYGLYNNKVKSIFITHQLLVKAPFAWVEKTLQFFNYRQIAKFHACWVPDLQGKPNLAGELSHPGKFPAVKTEYLGGISRFRKIDSNDFTFDLLIVISGPEPQRTILEKKLLNQLKAFKGRAMVVRGLPHSSETLLSSQRIGIKNHLNAEELQKCFSKSNMVISRSGYTTVMDICKLQKNAILIPTPGQTEQEYLAKHLETQGWCMAASQDDFLLDEQLLKAQNFIFRLPEMEMEEYKIVLHRFVQSLLFTRDTEAKGRKG